VSPTDELRDHFWHLSARLWLHSACHPKEPTWCYVTGDATLLIECARCGKTVIELKLAEGELTRVNGA